MILPEDRFRRWRDQIYPLNTAYMNFWSLTQGFLSEVNPEFMAYKFINKYPVLNPGLTHQWSLFLVQPILLFKLRPDG